GRGKGPAGNRLREGAIDEPRPAGDARLEDVLDLHPARAVTENLDPPGDIHPGGRPTAMDKAQLALRGLRPGQSAPRHRKAESEDRQQWSPRDERHEHSTVVAPRTERPRGDVMRKELRPPLDLAGQAKYDVGWGRDVDPDRAVHRAIAG